MFQTELEADRFERTIRHQLDGCTYRDPGQDRVRFGEWAERWWHTVEASTKVQYETILRRHVLPAITTGGSELFTPGLGDRRLVRLQRIDLEEWLAALSVAGRGASTIRTARTIAGMVLQSATRSGNDPGESPSRREGDQAGRFQCPKGSDTRVGRADGWVTAACARMRRSPCERVTLATTAACRWSRDWSRSVAISSGRMARRIGARTVALPPLIAADLHCHLARTVGAEHDALVFTTTHGQPLRLSTFGGC